MHRQRQLPNRCTVSARHYMKREVTRQCVRVGTSSSYVDCRAALFDIIPYPFRSHLDVDLVVLRAPDHRCFLHISEGPGRFAESRRPAVSVRSPVDQGRRAANGTISLPLRQRVIGLFTHCAMNRPRLSVRPYPEPTAEPHAGPRRVGDCRAFSIPPPGQPTGGAQPDGEENAEQFGIAVLSPDQAGAADGSGRLHRHHRHDPGVRLVSGRKPVHKSGQRVVLTSISALSYRFVRALLQRTSRTRQGRSRVEERGSVQTHDGTSSAHA